MIRNPILPGFNPDPSIVRVNEDYYLATSTFEWYPGVQIHHSRDLRHWRLMHRPLNRAALLDMRGNPDSGGIWAPCLSHADGRFWLIYTDVKRRDGNFKDTPNYLTTCETIDGEWSDPVAINASGFDPSLFHDDDGRKWFVNMLWDGRHGRNRFAGIVLQEYDPRQRRLVGPVSNIFPGTALGYTEAPHLYRRGDWYYLVTAEGGTGYTHAMTVARARDIRGPYKPDPAGYLLTTKDHRDSPLQRCGHGDLVETASGEHFLVHLCSRPIGGSRRSPLGRETALQRFEWSADGWPRLLGGPGPGLPALNVDSPDLPEHPWPEPPQRRDFDGPDLPMEFQWLRTPEPERFINLEARPGWLRLVGRGSMGNTFEQALVARRQEHLACSVETRLDVQPLGFQHSAGLVSYYNGHKFHYLLVSVDDEGRRYLDVMSCPADTGNAVIYPLREGQLDPSATDERFVLPDAGPVWLGADIDGRDLVFRYSTDGERWTSLPLTLDQSLISDEAGAGEGASFTGAFLGMACQDLSGGGAHADFDSFSYRPR